MSLFSSLSKKQKSVLYQFMIQFTIIFLVIDSVAATPFMVESKDLIRGSITIKVHTMRKLYLVGAILPPRL